jgi:hypothetical protein
MSLPYQSLGQNQIQYQLNPRKIKNKGTLSGDALAQHDGVEFQCLRPKT